MSCRITEENTTSFSVMSTFFSPIIDTKTSNNCAKEVIILPQGIDPFHKWLPMINCFVISKISLTNLVLS